MSFGVGTNETVRYGVSVERGSILVAIFESTSPAKTGVLVVPVFLGFKFSDRYRLGC